MHHTKYKLLLFIFLVSASVLCLFASFLFLYLSQNPSQTVSSLRISSSASTQPKTSFFGRIISRLSPSSPVKITLAGDVLLARTVAAQSKKQQDLNYPFQKVAPYLQSADISFFNLESPVASIPGEVPINSTIFHIDPEFAPALSASGVDIVSLANNHSVNQGEAGLKSTIATLGSLGIRVVGAGLSSSIHTPQIFEINGQKIGFLAYTDPSLVPKSYAASEDHLGTAMMDLTQVTHDIKSAALQVDWLFVSFHFGNEYSPLPSAKQTEFAHTAIDSGANFVIGHHPHVLQPIEEYKNGIIFYSLGNFVFDQMFSLPTRESVLVTLELNKNHTKKVTLFPLMIDNFSQPRLATRSEAKVQSEQSSRGTADEYSLILKALQVPPDSTIFSFQ